MDGCLHEWMDGWIEEWVDVWIEEWMDGWIIKCMYGWMKSECCDETLMSYWDELLVNHGVQSDDHPR